MKIGAWERILSFLGQKAYFLVLAVSFREGIPQKTHMTIENHPFFNRESIFKCCFFLFVMYRDPAGVVFTVRTEQFKALWHELHKTSARTSQAVQTPALNGNGKLPPTKYTINNQPFMHKMDPYWL